jgi:hypothetical protein
MRQSTPAIGRYPGWFVAGMVGGMFNPDCKLTKAKASQLYEVQDADTGRWLFARFPWRPIEALPSMQRDSTGQAKMQPPWQSGAPPQSSVRFSIRNRDRSPRSTPMIFKPNA